MSPYSKSKPHRDEIERTRIKFDASGVKTRAAWVDNLRTAVIVLVVNMHSCVTYSHVGDWYLKDGAEGSLTEKLPYIFWIFHLQSFFMGILFFLGGVFAHEAIDRRGVASFIRERLFRLGVPAIVYMLVMQPLIVYGLLNVASGANNSSWRLWYTQYLSTGHVLSGSGPMWFVIALLAFSIVFAFWQCAFGHQAAKNRPVPAASTMIVFGCALATFTALIRIPFPVGSNFYNLQLGYFPQYVAAFAVGVIAAKRGWFNALAATYRAKVWGYASVFVGPIALALLLNFGGSPTEGSIPGEHGPILYFGGWSVQAFGAAFWEQLTGLGLALGMIALFQSKFNGAGNVSRWLASRSFAVYFIHPLVLVSLTLLYRDVHIVPLLKIILLTISGLTLSFLIADIAKRIPVLRNFL